MILPLMLSVLVASQSDIPALSSSEPATATPVVEPAAPAVAPASPAVAPAAPDARAPDASSTQANEEAAAKKAHNKKKAMDLAIALGVTNAVAFPVLIAGGVGAGVLLAPLGPVGALAIAIPVVGVPLTLLIATYVLTDNGEEFAIAGVGTITGHYVGLVGGTLGGAIAGTVGYGALWSLGCLTGASAADACGFALLGFPLAAVGGGLLGAGIGGTIGSAAGGAMGMNVATAE